MKEFLRGYEDIRASEELKKTVKNKIALSRRKRACRSVAACAASVCIVFTVCMNISEEMALAACGIPILSDIVNVVTAGRYNIEIGGSSAKIDVPQFEGLSDKEMEKKLNEQLGREAASLAAEFKADAEELAEMSDGEGHMGVESGYIIRTDNDDYLAVDMFVFNVVGSSSTTHKFYTIDKKTGKFVTLEEIFKPGCDYTGRISEIVKKEMLRRNAEEEGLFFVEADEYTEGFGGIAGDAKFFINDNGNIVICFDKYEVAAGAQGSPEFEISPEDIADILK